MNRNKVPIVNILDLIKKKIILVSIIFTISIGLSFFYNLNFKTIKYNYSIEFIPISNWRASELGLSDKIINGLTKNLILKKLKNIDQISYKLNFSDIITVSFQSYKPLDVQGFEQSLNSSLDEEIKNKLQAKINFLEYENSNRLKLSQLTKENRKIRITNELSTLKLQQSEMINQFGKLISEKFDAKNILINAANNLESVINLKKEYYKLTKKILTTKAELDLINKEPDNYMQFGNLFSEDTMQQTIQRYNDLTKNESEIFSLKVNLEEYDFVKSSDINSMGGWKILNNNLSYLEIIIAGILFGLLSNTFILFLSSSYFKKNIIN
jgi:hypothetical protein